MRVRFAVFCCCCAGLVRPSDAAFGVASPTNLPRGGGSTTTTRLWKQQSPNNNNNNNSQKQQPFFAGESVSSPDGVVPSKQKPTARASSMSPVAMTPTTATEAGTKALSTAADTTLMPVRINAPLTKDIVAIEGVTEEEEEHPMDRSLNDDFAHSNDDGDDSMDIQYMRMAMDLAKLDGGERGPRSAYPSPTVGAILVSHDDRILGRGRSDYRTEAVRDCLTDAGLTITPLSEWAVTWPADAQLRATLASATLYTTLEPTTRRRGSAMPSVTALIRASGIVRVVIGCPSPVPEKAMKGASVLHEAGLAVKVMNGSNNKNNNNNTTVSPSLAVAEECRELIADYSALANGKLQRMARNHFEIFGRPLGFMHCSVIESDNVEAFSRHGNAFGTHFAGGNGQPLSYRKLGAYELAPPPDVIWASDDDEDENMDFYESLDGDNGVPNILSIDFEDENNQGGMKKDSPMMPWYEQVDAVVVTFPRSGNGPPDDDSVAARLNGLRWLATHGKDLPAGVERILVMDATELRDLPLTNDNPNLYLTKSSGGGSGGAPHVVVDVEAFWEGKDRKPVRVLLRRGRNEAARAAAAAAAVAAQAAANAAAVAASAIESGDADRAAQAALECQAAATASQEFIQRELEVTQVLRRKLEERGVIVETLEGGEPIDIMKHLGERHGMYSVVWRAGCWGDRGVRAILAGAFQWVSAHLAVEAHGGRFWQLMMAENAVQAACGPQSKVKVFADQEDISMEYCDNVDVDDDCVLTVDGTPVRHVRLDCRVGLVDENRPREFLIAETQKLDRKMLVERAPWFL